MIGRSAAPATRRKCSTAISGRRPMVKGPGGKTSSAAAPPSAAIFAMRAERRLVDGKIVVERQEHRGDDALGNPVHVSGHFGLRYGRARGYCGHSTRIR